MLTVFLVGGCIFGLVMLGLLGLALFIIMRASERDPVSAARQDWIQRRSDKDEQAW